MKRKQPHQTDIQRARKFAVAWATRDSSGDIANLARAFLAISGKAHAVTAAADACDREAQNHPSSRSSAPLVRYVDAMKDLREVLAQFKRSGGDWQAPP